MWAVPGQTTSVAQVPAQEGKEDQVSKEKAQGQRQPSLLSSIAFFPDRWVRLCPQKGEVVKYGANHFLSGMSEQRLCTPILAAHRLGVGRGCGGQEGHFISHLPGLLNTG